MGTSREERRHHRDRLFYADMIDDQASVIAATIDAFRIATDRSGNAAESIARISLAIGVQSFTEMLRRR